MRDKTVEDPIEEWRYAEREPTSPTGYVWAMILISIALGFCCYLLLNL